MGIRGWECERATDTGVVARYCSPTTRTEAFCLGNIGDRDGQDTSPTMIRIDKCPYVRLKRARSARETYET